MTTDIDTLVQHLKDASIDIKGMMYDDAYETVFSAVTDMFAAADIPVEGEILHACQEATEEYLKITPRFLVDMTEAVGDLPHGYTEEDFAELFDKFADTDTFNDIDNEDGPCEPLDEDKMKMAHYISVYGAPDYNGHQWFKTLHGKEVEDFSDDDFDAAEEVGIKIDYSYDTITLTFPDGYDDIYPACTPSSPYEGRKDESTTIDKFLNKLDERNGMSIAANNNYTRGAAIQKLLKKFNIHDYSEYGKENIDGEDFEVFRINKNFYGLDANKDVWALDSRKVTKEVQKYEDEYENFNGEAEWVGRHPVPGETEIEEITEYQINSRVEEPAIVDFLKAIIYVSSEEAYNARHNAKQYDKDRVSKELEQAKQFINVEITNSKFKTAADFADDVDDESWSGCDDEAEFDITVKISDKTFEGTAYTCIGYEGSDELTYYRPATMYRSNGDPGDPAESAGVITVSYTGLEGDTDILNDDGEDLIPIIAESIPEGKFRQLFNDYFTTIVEGAIEDKVMLAGDYEQDYS